MEEKGRLCESEYLFMAESIFKPKLSDMAFHALSSKPKIYTAGFQSLSNYFPWFLFRIFLNILNHRARVERQEKGRI